jgi:hypothetical protein
VGVATTIQDFGGQSVGERERERKKSVNNNKKEETAVGHDDQQ